MASSTNGSIPKWQIAVALGATGAIGLGVWYMRKNSTKSNPGAAKKKSDKCVTEKSAVPKKEEAVTPLGTAQKFKEEGNNFFKNGKYADAIAQYDKAIEVCPKEHRIELATYYQNRAAAYENLKKWSAVKSDCTTALELNPSYQKALVRRAKACENLKDYEQALDDITLTCLMQGFQDQSTLLTADRILKELGRKHAIEALAKREPILPSPFYIKSYFNSFAEDPVYNEIKKVVNFEVDDGLSKIRLAFNEGRFDEVVDLCTEIINEENANAKERILSLLLRSTFHFLYGSNSKALDDLNTIINDAEAPSKVKVNAFIKRAVLHIQLDNFDECLKDFSNAIEANPDVSDIYHHRGQMLLLKDRTEEASKDFDKAVTLNGEFPIAFAQKCYVDYRIALLSKDLPKLQKAMDAFKDSIKKFPDCSECFSLYAQVLVDQQEYEKSEKMYEKAWNIEKNPTILVNKGLLHLQWKGDVEKTVSLFNEAIKLDPLCQFAYETLGTMEVQRGNLSQAIELFEKASKLAKTETEMTHIFSLKCAAASQLKLSQSRGFNNQ